MKHVSLPADIVAVLEENDNRWMAPDILAMVVNDRRLLRRLSDDKRATSRDVISCVTARANRDRFERKGTFIRLAVRGAPREY